MFTWHEEKLTGEYFDRIVSNPSRNLDKTKITPQKINNELTIGEAITPTDESGHCTGASGVTSQNSKSL